MNYDLMIEDDLPGDDEIVLNDKKSKFVQFSDEEEQMIAKAKKYAILFMQNYGKGETRSKRNFIDRNYYNNKH